MKENRPKVEKVEKLTNRKFVNLYVARFVDGKNVIDYEIASRKDEKHLDVISNKKSVDAVRILPYFFDENKTLNIVLIHEFRYPINDYIYGLPAGLIDEGEDYQTSAIRELEEEIGAKVLKISQSEPPSYTSAGFCDESIVCFNAQIQLGGKQNLGEGERITFKAYPLGEVMKMLEKENFGLQSRLQLKSFIYEYLYNSLKSSK